MTISMYVCQKLVTGKHSSDLYFLLRAAGGARVGNNEKTVIKRFNVHLNPENASVYFDWNKCLFLREILLMLIIQWFISSTMLLTRSTEHIKMSQRWIIVLLSHLWRIVWTMLSLLKIKLFLLISEEYYHILLGIYY